MKRKGVFRLVVVLSMCLLVVHLHAQEAIQVAGLFSDAISLGCGSEQGVKVGATGRVYLREMVGGKMWPIYIAKFRVTSVEANNCRAKVLEKTRDIAIGHFITFDKPLVPPAAKPAPAAEPKAEKPQAKPANAASARTYSLSISTVPEDVMIYINGKKSGRGPLKMDMSKPDCDVRIERNGYATIEDSFTISENGMTKNYELKPLTVAVPAVAAKPVAEKKLEMGKYPVRIVVEPADAEININGNKGRSPFEVMLNTPRCQVSIVRSGYETVSETLDLSEGGVIKNYKLNPMIAASIAVGQKKGTLTAAESLNLKEIDKKVYCFISHLQVPVFLCEIIHLQSSNNRLFHLPPGFS